jgi:hypothetical protein
MSGASSYHNATHSLPLTVRDCNATNEFLCGLRFGSWKLHILKATGFLVGLLIGRNFYGHSFYMKHGMWNAVGYLRRETEVGSVGKLASKIFSGGNYFWSKFSSGYILCMPQTH